MRSRYSRRTRRYGRRAIGRRRRTIVRRPIRRRTTTRRRILNVASLKKQDNQEGAALVSGTPVSGTLALSPAGLPTAVLSSPTARMQGGNNAGSYNPPALRSNQFCYYRGFTERVKFVTAGASAWEWRRLVVSFKSDPLVGPSIPFGGAYLANSTTGVTYRNISALSNINLTNAANVLFKGNQGDDWNNIFTAAPDRQRVKVHSDQYRIITPATTSNNVKQYKFYTPLNKTLAYSDDESGVTEASNWWAAGPTGTLGDVYVLDIFKCASDVGSDAANVAFECTAYWHER